MIERSAHVTNRELKLTSTFGNYLSCDLVQFCARTISKLTSITILLEENLMSLSAKSDATSVAAMTITMDLHVGANISSSEGSQNISLNLLAHLCC